MSTRDERAAKRGKEAVPPTPEQVAAATQACQVFMVKIQGMRAQEKTRLQQIRRSALERNIQYHRDRIAEAEEELAELDV